MAKKQKSFADKAAGSKEKDAVYVKYVKSVRSEKTGQWRFNEQMVRTKKGEQFDVALKRMDEVANLVDIDLSEFEITEPIVEETAPDVAEESASNEGSQEDVQEEVAEETTAEEDSTEEVDSDTKSAEMESSAEEETPTEEEAVQKEE